LSVYQFTNHIIVLCLGWKPLNSAHVQPSWLPCTMTQLVPRAVCCRYEDDEGAYSRGTREGVRMRGGSEVSPRLDDPLFRCVCRRIQATTGT